MSDFMNRIFTTAMAFAVMATACSEKKNSTDSARTANEEVTTVSTEDDGTAETAENPTEKNPTAESLSVKKTSESEFFSDRDLNPKYDGVTAEISLNSDSASISGSGATAENSCVTITQEGIYRISGTLDNGQIVVDADKAKVQLVLDNATINSNSSSAINIISADKTFITLADGSKNTLSDGLENDENNTQDAVIFSKDSLTLNGNGELIISASYNDGIHSKDDIVITGGNITVDTAGNAIKGKDYVAVSDGVLNLTAGKNGIKSTNIEDSSLGFIYAEGGVFNITSDGDCIQSQTYFTANGGEFNLVSGGGSANSTKTHSDDFKGFGKGFDRDFEKDFGGDFDFKNRPEMPDDFSEIPPMQNEKFNPDNVMQTALSETTETESTSEKASTKGIKADTEINIFGGTFDMDSADDAIHSNKDVNISGGIIGISAGGKGIHANSAIDINGGAVNIEECYEGLEASVISVNDGTVEVNSSDDGFNASDGVTSQSGMGVYSESLSVNINGGTVYVNASGDGLDSNGDIYINGGTVIIDGCENGGNGSLDSNGEIVVTGGKLVAVGMSGMAESPSENSTQYSVSATFDETFSSNTTVTLTDSSGKEIISFLTKKSFDNIIISTPDILQGETYTLYTGGTSSESEYHGLYENGGYNNDGTESGSFTAESVISFVGKQSAMGGGFSGRMHGGMNRDGDFDFSERPEMHDRHEKHFNQDNNDNAVF
ncbi:MAG: carbohydrate-binding domain-containing protein [Ruminococcus sp.]|nr:carbohydrate-binding domain-containing protein [Ruminococcus sp.]